MSPFSPCVFLSKEESACDNLSKDQNSFCINNGKVLPPQYKMKYYALVSGWGRTTFGGIFYFI